MKGYVVSGVFNQNNPSNAFGVGVSTWHEVWFRDSPSELAAGAASFKGMIDLWSARNADAATFNAAKKWGIVGAGLGVIVWFGYFHGIGGAYFQMWQTEAGANALMGAFQYAMMCGLVALLLMQKDD